VDFRYELYSGAKHDFSIPQHKADERANVQSIASTARFLKETFGEKGYRQFGLAVAANFICGHGDTSTISENDPVSDNECRR
jgi:hypothetical protein